MAYLTEADNQRERIRMIDHMLADPKLGDLTRSGLEKSRGDAERIIADLESSPHQDAIMSV